MLVKKSAAKGPLLVKINITPLRKVEAFGVLIPFQTQQPNSSTT